MIWTHTGRFRDCLKNAQLVDNCVENFIRLYRQFLSPEIFPIEQARVRANRDFAVARGFDRSAYCLGVARMKAAGNICGCDESEQFVIVAGAFAEVGVKIDNGAH